MCCMGAVALTDAVQGVGVIVFTGLLWAVSGAFFSHVARRGMKPCAFGLAMASSVSVLGWALLCNWGALRRGDISRAPELVLILSVAGMLNWAGMLLMMAAMRRGHQAGSWTVAQSAMVIPFLAGALLWHDSLMAVHGAGALLILAAIPLFGQQKSHVEADAAGGRWFPMALLAFGVLGLSQTLCRVPSHWPGWVDTGRLHD